jgi:uracil-DNA glycosylase
MSERTELLRAIKDEIVALTTSPLYAYRKDNNYFPVIGQGNHHAQIMFIGEAPGENEAKTGRPFVGRAGALLDEMLQGIGIDREEVYITNILKDRPPNNRDPLRPEIDAYTPYLERQIDIIQPAVIATLGRFAMEFIFSLMSVPEKKPKISKLQGRLLQGQASYGTINVMPIYHPAYVLRNPAARPDLEASFETLKQFLD